MNNDPEPYLILHKVRGAPAFDIAHQIEMEGEECWIVGTSGHRAYPVRFMKLYSISLEQFLSVPMEVPNDWPDHYPVNKSPPEEKLEARSLLASLGLPTTTHNAMTGRLVRRV